MHHFFLTLPDGEVRPLSAPYLPRVGDTITIEDHVIVINTVNWISNGKTLADEPMLNGTNIIHSQYTVGADHMQLAMRLAQGYGTGKKIPAIKDLRSQTQLGLKEAKDLIDRAYTLLGL